MNQTAYIAIYPNMVIINSEDYDPDEWERIRETAYPTKVKALEILNRAANDKVHRLNAELGIVLGQQMRLGDLLARAEQEQDNG